MADKTDGTVNHARDQDFSPKEYMQDLTYIAVFLKDFASCAHEFRQIARVELALLDETGLMRPARFFPSGKTSEI